MVRFTFQSVLRDRKRPRDGAESSAGAAARGPIPTSTPPSKRARVVTIPPPRHVSASSSSSSSSSSSPSAPLELFFVPRAPCPPVAFSGCDIRGPTCDLTANLSWQGPDGEITHRLNMHSFGGDGLRSLGILDPSVADLSTSHVVSRMLQIPKDADLMQRMPVASQFAKVRSTLFSSLCEFQYLYDNCADMLLTEKEQHTSVVTELVSCRRQAEADKRAATEEIRKLKTELLAEKEESELSGQHYAYKMSALQQNLRQREQELEEVPARIEAIEKKTVSAVIDGFADCYGEEAFNTERLGSCVNLRLIEIEMDGADDDVGAGHHVGVDDEDGLDGGE